MKTRLYKPPERGDVERREGLSGWMNRIAESSAEAMREFLEELERKGIHTLPSPEKAVKAMKIYQKYRKKLLPLHALLIKLLERNQP